MTLGASKEDMIDIDIRPNLQPFICKSESPYDLNILELKEQHERVNEARLSVLKYIDYSMSSSFFGISIF